MVSDGKRRKILLKELGNPQSGYHTFIRNTALSILLPNYADAEDAMQEVYQKIFRTKLETYNPSRNFEKWLKKVTKNKCLDILRREKVRKTILVNIDVFAQNSSGERYDLDEICTNEDNYLNHLEYVDEAGKAREIMSALPENLRMPLEMKIEEFEYSQIGKILGIPEGTAKRKVHEARELIKERMAA